MSPSGKFNALLVSATVSLMFFLVLYVGPLLVAAGAKQPLLLPAAGLVTSAGVYSLLTVALRWLMDRSECIKGLVLGPHYFHGTWVGWFRGHTNEFRYMVEHFTQDLDHLAISGRSFTEAQDEHGYWTSDSVSIDSKRGRLVFTYSFDIVSGRAALVGIHASLLERQSSRHAPRAYAGLAHDLNDPARIGVHSKKISTALLPWDEALAKAVELFEGKV